MYKKNLRYSIQLWNLSISNRHGNNTRPRGYPLIPTPIWRVFPALTGFGYGYGFFSISKHGYGMGNRVICTHPEPIPIPVPNVKNYFFFYPFYINRNTTLDQFTPVQTTDLIARRHFSGNVKGNIMLYNIAIGVWKKINKKWPTTGTGMGSPNPSGMGMGFNFSSPLGMGRVMGKYVRIGYGEGEGKTRPHPAPLPCLISNHLPWMSSNLYQTQNEST